MKFKDLFNVMLILFLSVGILSGCVTFNYKANENTKKSLSGKKVSVVLQLGKEKPIISKYKRSFWVSARKTNKIGVFKLYADLAAGESDVAIIEARNYLRIHPKNIDGLNVLSLALAMSGKYSLAKYYAQKAEENFGENPESLNVIGLATVMQSKNSMEDYLAAARYFRRAFDLYPTEVASGLNLGSLYLEIGNARQAADVFETVKSRCHNCYYSYMGAGIAYSRLKNYHKAKENFEYILSANPKAYQAIYRLALIEEIGFNNIDKSINYLKKIVYSPYLKNGILKQRANSILRKLETEFNDNLAIDNNISNNKINNKDKEIINSININNTKDETLDKVSFP